MKRLPRGGRLLSAVALATLALDQLTKALVIRSLAPGQSWPEAGVGRFFSFTHVHNTGIAFGLFRGRSEVLIWVSLAVVAGLLYYQHHLPTDARWVRAAIGLQVGGALGNLADRLRLGHVTDFLDFKVWPVFNVADSSIFVGVLMLTVYLWQLERAQQAAEAGAQAAAIEEPLD